MSGVARSRSIVGRNARARVGSARNASVKKELAPSTLWDLVRRILLALHLRKEHKGIRQGIANS